MIKEITASDINKIYNLGTIYTKDFTKKYNLDNIIENQNETIYFYELDDIAVGYIHITHVIDEIDIINVFVLEEYRNKSIASKLMDTIINNYPNNKISLEVNVNNKNAIKLYEKYNFKKVSTRKNYYQQEDAYIMIRS